MATIRQQKNKEIVFFHGKRKILGNEIPTYVYLVDGLLIDTGPRRMSSFYRPKFSDKRIDQVAITHHHEDHTGNAAFLAARGIPVYIHTSAVNLTEKRAKIPFYRQVFWGEREPFPSLALERSFQTTGGQQVIVIETPGHTDDHVTFYLPEEGAIFTGDLFVSPKTKMGATGENYWKWIRSLDALLEYDFDTIYCSHSGIISEGKAQVARKAELLKELRERVAELKQKGLGVKEINKSIFPKTLPIKYFSGGEWDSIHIIKSFMMGE
ncbi:MAG: MBL fold metallo-hydrolase [Bacillota bacterium]